MRMGKKKQPTYRMVAADARSPRDGRFIEIVGTYQPRAEPSVVNVDNDKAVEWLRKGAQPTDRVRRLLEISGAWGQFKDGSVKGGSPQGQAARTEPAKTEAGT
jgi:small subunit ribosomal protein S16